MVASPLGHRAAPGRVRDARGAAALEFALVVIPLLMLVFGIVTFGLGYSNYVALNNTVREGARFGASTASTATWGNDVVTQTVNLYADANNPLTASDVCALLIKKAGATFTTKQSSSAGCSAGTTAAGPVPATPASMSDGCFVKVWASRPANLNWIAGQLTVTLKARSVSVYDRSQLCS